MLLFLIKFVDAISFALLEKVNESRLQECDECDADCFTLLRNGIFISCWFEKKCTEIRVRVYSACQHSAKIFQICVHEEVTSGAMIASNRSRANQEMKLNRGI